MIAYSQLTDDGHEWLKSLTSRLTEDEGKRILHSVAALKDKREQDDVESVLQLTMTENKAVFDKLKEVPGMKNQALMDFMRPELEEERAEGRAEGRTEGVFQARADMVKRALSLGNSVEQVALLLGTSEDEVRKLSRA